MWQSFLWILTAVVLIGIFGSAVTFPSVVTWYAGLTKPCLLNPPDWLFALIWPVMYLLLVLGTYFGYESVFCGPQRSALILTFGVVAVLIALWPYIFFYRRNAVGGMIVILLLLIAVFLQIWITLNLVKNPIAAALLVPLLFWVAYASYLNIAIVILNPCERHLRLC